MQIPKHQHQGGLAKVRPPRPNLTLDTQPPLHSLANDLCTQSAPVGTRQDKGYAPMYQAGDRHCEKLAEMMDSPTWRSQNIVPYKGYSHVQHPPPSNEESPYSVDYQKEYATHTGLPKQNSQDGQPTGEVLHLGRCGDDVEILGIQPFLDVPDISNNTFVISAAISQRSLRQHGGFPDNDSSDHEESPDGLPHPATSPEETHTVRQEMRQKFEDNAHNAMKHDEAIQSINNNMRSPNRQRQATSDEQQRFKGLLDRLHQSRQGDNSKQGQAASFVDPAIIAFVPKKADLGTPTKRSTRNRSDSGYASPSICSRPSTRAQSRMGREKSDSTESGTVRIEHRKPGSHDSGFDESPSKNSVLNPTAKEFSIPSASKVSPVKKGLVIPPSVATRVFVPSRQAEMSGSLSVPQAGAALQPSQGPWLSSRPNVNNPSMALASIQQGVMPGMIAPWNNSIGASMPCAASMDPVGLPPYLAPLPGLGLVPGLGLTGLTASPDLGRANMSSPFHHQLSSLGLCCNAAHQAMGAFSPPALHGVIPAAVAPQPSVPSVSLTGQTPSSLPFIPKNVPKPKVPNTTGQQNWELMHELRRMNEPGYAQRCKEKQKKRYMKQLEKTGSHP